MIKFYKTQNGYIKTTGNLENAKEVTQEEYENFVKEAEQRIEKQAEESLKNQPPTEEEKLQAEIDELKRFIYENIGRK